MTGEPPTDLTKVGGTAVQGVSAGRDAFGTVVLPLEDRPYDPARDRETVRGRIAMTLVWTLIVLVGFVALIGLVTAVLCSWSGACSNDTLELRVVRTIVELVLTPLVGLVGAVTGFYYGERRTGG